MHTDWRRARGAEARGPLPADGTKRRLRRGDAAGENGDVYLKKAGAIDYYCRFHPNMKAVLTVAP
jgi:plastocyanin